MFPSTFVILGGTTWSAGPYNQTETIDGIDRKTISFIGRKYLVLRLPLEKIFSVV